MEIAKKGRDAKLAEPEAERQAGPRLI